MPEIKKGRGLTKEPLVESLKMAPPLYVALNKMSLHLKLVNYAFCFTLEKTKVRRDGTKRAKVKERSGGIGCALNSSFITFLPITLRK